MPQRIVRFLLVGTLAMLFVPSTLAQMVAVGTCMPNLKMYSTISQAVAAVSSGSTIFVCRLPTPNQVLIANPLTLEGVQAGNADNPTITVPSGGLKGSAVAPTNGATMFYQILAQGTESGSLNINNLAVDGSSSANYKLFSFNEL